MIYITDSDIRIIVGPIKNTGLGNPTKTIRLTLKNMKMKEDEIVSYVKDSIKEHFDLLSYEIKQEEAADIVGKEPSLKLNEAFKIASKKSPSITVH